MDSTRQLFESLRVRVSAAVYVLLSLMYVGGFLKFPSLQTVI